MPRQPPGASDLAARDRRRGQLSQRRLHAATLCHAPVRYVLEPHPGQSRARNRGILETTGDFVAFTDDDCVVDPGWLDDLGGSFSDPLVMGVTGYVGPVELESPSQILFELHGGFQRGLEYTVFDGATEIAAYVSPAVSAPART